MKKITKNLTLTKLTLRQLHLVAGGASTVQDETKTCGCTPPH
jgi:hypothetical protein